MQGLCPSTPDRPNTWIPTATDGEKKESGVSDGIRTRDVQIHSLALYQAELRSPHQRATPPDVRYTFVASGTEKCQLAVLYRLVS
jgi:hypothetical protein